MPERAPQELWEFYLQLGQVEQAFKQLKGDLAIRPIHHQKEPRIEAHIFISFLAYCVQVTLGHRLKALAPGLTARAVLEKMRAIQMIDRCAPAHHRWSQSHSDPLHQTRTRSANAYRKTKAESAHTTPSQNHCRSTSSNRTIVVKTFEIVPLISRT